MPLADRLYQVGPVRSIHFYRCNHISLREIESLAQSPHLAASPYLKGLQRLHLEANLIGHEGKEVRRGWFGERVSF